MVDIYISYINEHESTIVPINIGGSKTEVPQKWRLFFCLMEHPFKIDDLGVPLFGNPHILSIIQWDLMGCSLLSCFVSLGYRSSRIYDDCGACNYG